MTEIEEGNIRYTCMVQGYKILRSSQDAAPYYALASYEKNGRPLDFFMKRKQVHELLNDYSLLGRKCFNDALEFINCLKIDLLDKTPIFEIPLSDKTLTYLSTLPQFAKLKKHEIVQLTQDYPVEGLVFVQTQNALAAHFRKVVTHRWQEKITQYVEKMIAKNFGRKKKASQVRDHRVLNPFLVRFFKAVYSI